MASSAFAEGPATAVPILGASIGAGLDALGDSSSLVAWSLSESLYASAQEHEHSVGHHKSAVSWGAKSSQGGRTSQEDAYCVQESLSPPASRSLADTGSPSPPHHPSSIDGDHQPQPGQPQEQQQGTSGSGSGAAFQQWDGNQSLSLPFLPEDLTFFGVYDGHGGQEVAQHCSENLHRHFAEHISMARFESTCSLRRSGSGASASSSDEGRQQSREEGTKEQAALGSPTAVSSMCAEGSLASDSAHVSTPMASAAPALSPAASADAAGRAGRFIKDALRQAFAKTDADLAGTDVGEFVGATAVVAVMAREHIYIAHCGDSRAVVQRGGEATPVTRDHKPDREDEMERVRAAGGKVVFNSGSYRVMGMLAMSRAIGDHFLRPYVIAEPEITVLERTPEDEILVIATDGLWDVFSSQEAAGLASRCIQRSKERGMTGHGACRVAASVLTRVAIARGSRDNITVIVVDISEPPRQVEASETSKDKCAVPNSAQGPGAISKNGSFSLGTYCWLKSQQQAGQQGGKSGADDRHCGSHQSNAHASENRRENAGSSAAAAYAHARARLAAARARTMARAASAAAAATATSVSGCSVLGRRSRSAMEEGSFGGAHDGANSPAMHQQQQHCQQLDELQHMQHMVDASQLAKAMRHAYSCRYPPHGCGMLPVGAGGMHAELAPSSCVAEPAACWSAVDTARTMAV